MARWVIRVSAFLLVLAGFFTVLIVLGQRAREQIGQGERYQAAWSDIDCAPPPGLDRTSFLEEVQYLAGLPDRLNLLDEGLGRRLAGAFAKHPWVEKVLAVTLEPPRQVKVQLQYRKPVLAVPVGKVLRAVDGQGVLLPREAPVDGLGVFMGQATAPAGPAGTRWGDPEVEKLARSLKKD